MFESTKKSFIFSISTTVILFTVFNYLGAVFDTRQSQNEASKNYINIFTDSKIAQTNEIKESHQKNNISCLKACKDDKKQVNNHLLHDNYQQKQDFGFHLSHEENPLSEKIIRNQDSIEKTKLENISKTEIQTKNQYSEKKEDNLTEVPEELMRKKISYYDKSIQMIADRAGEQSKIDSQTHLREKKSENVLEASDLGIDIAGNDFNWMNIRNLNISPPISEQITFLEDIICTSMKNEDSNTSDTESMLEDALSHTDDLETKTTALKRNIENSNLKNNILSENAGFKNTKSLTRAGKKGNQTKNAEFKKLQKRIDEIKGNILIQENTEQRSNSSSNNEHKQDSQNVDAIDDSCHGTPFSIFNEFDFFQKLGSVTDSTKKCFENNTGTSENSHISNANSESNKLSKKMAVVDPLNFYHRAFSDSEKPNIYQKPNEIMCGSSKIGDTVQSNYCKISPIETTKRKKIHPLGIQEKKVCQVFPLSVYSEGLQSNIGQDLSTALNRNTEYLGTSDSTSQHTNSLHSSNHESIQNNTLNFSSYFSSNGIRDVANNHEIFQIIFYCGHKKKCKFEYFSDDALNNYPFFSFIINLNCKNLLTDFSKQYIYDIHGTNISTKNLNPIAYRNKIKNFQLRVSTFYDSYSNNFQSVFRQTNFLEYLKILEMERRLSETPQGLTFLRTILTQSKENTSEIPNGVLQNSQTGADEIKKTIDMFLETENRPFLRKILNSLKFTTTEKLKHNPCEDKLIIFNIINLYNNRWESMSIGFQNIIIEIVGLLRPEILYLGGEENRILKDIHFCAETFFKSQNNAPFLVAKTSKLDLCLIMKTEYHVSDQKEQKVLDELWDAIQELKADTEVFLR